MSKEYKIGNKLMELGVSAHLKGFKYLVTAVKAASEEPELVEVVTSGLYPLVAKTHSTTPSRVERAIRHAVESAFNNPDAVDAIGECFGRTCSTLKGKLTNSEFVAGLAWHVQHNPEVYNDGM